MDSRFRGNDGSPVEDIRPDVAELAVHPIALNAKRARYIVMVFTNM
jgi:hypothetical protein